MAVIVPPRSHAPGDGAFTFPNDLRVGSIHHADVIPARQLIDELSTVGSAAAYTRSTKGAEILIRRVRSAGSPEGYELQVTPQRIVVSAPSDAGAYYAVQTLRELVREHGTTIPAGTITDEPDFPRRGFYLDCSRGKVPTLQTIFRLIEQLAHWKVNELQLYVENVFTFARHPAIGEGYSPLTPADIRAIQEHAGIHHISLVPSLTSLGHFEKILMLPEYQELGELPGWNDLPGGSTLNPLNPQALALVRDMYEEFLPLFSAEDFNACGDEPWELGQGRSREKAEKLGLGRVYLDFILELRGLSMAAGKRINIWGDIVLKHPEIIPEIPKELVLLNWDYSLNGSMLSRTNEFAQAGLPLVCCPGTNGWQSHGTRLGVCMKNVHQFVGIAHEHAAEGILNTDWGDIGHRNALGVSLHGIAYAAACSWNYRGTPGPDTDSFSRAFVSQTFGDRDGALLPWLQTIGDDELGHWAYHSLLESLTKPDGFGNGFSRVRTVIDEVELQDEAIAQKVSAADALDERGFPLLPAVREPFLALALEEYEIANRMNRESVRRVTLARQIRGGTDPERVGLADHRDALASLRADLERTWMARNRRSRLDDSLVGFDQAMEEVGEILA